MEDAEFKTCPFCKGKIRVVAVKCSSCGKWLEQPTSSQPSFAQMMSAREIKPNVFGKKPKEFVKPPRDVKSKSRFAQWEDGINNIPIPQNSNTAYWLIFGGVVVLLFGVSFFILLGLLAEKTGHYNGSISISFLIVLGIVLTGLAMLIRGAWFFFANTRLYRLIFVLVEKYSSLSRWKKCFSALVVEFLGVIIFFQIKYFENVNIQLLLIMSALVMILAGVVMMCRAFKK